MRRELITWNEVHKLIDHLMVQFEEEYQAMMIITRGGIVPGGLLAEAMDITHILTAAVDFPFEAESGQSKLLIWPKFIQFPENEVISGRRVLIVDDVWGSGRTITAVKNRVSAGGGLPYTCVLHFNPYRNLFGTARPDYFAASTDAHIVYPWEVDEGPDRILREN
ncbi:MAG TPA: phosphoribosyltransferase family protein [Anaerolineales bacterium]|nr:phosphoribosyltransferase family protein [Anaerolineales bacterium]